MRVVAVTFRWEIRELDAVTGAARFREELRKLRTSRNTNDITELAALGVAFCLVSRLLPGDKITRIVPLGGKGDYYLNGRRDEMIEVSGTVKGDLQARFEKKSRQILANERLTRAFVSVTRFAPGGSILGRVR